MSKGWIKLHRKLTADPIFSSEKGLKVWIWCLLKATHQNKDVFLGRVPVNLTAGQFVFGRKIASVELGISPSTIWWWMCQLDSCGYVNITKTSKYSVVTILKWDKYQVVDSKPVAELTTDEKQIDTYNKDIKNGEKPPNFKNKNGEGKRGKDVGKDGWPLIIGSVVQTSYIKNKNPKYQEHIKSLNKKKP